MRFCIFLQSEFTLLILLRINNQPVIDSCFFTGVWNSNFTECSLSYYNFVIKKTYDLTYLYFLHTRSNRKILNISKFCTFLKKYYRVLFTDQIALNRLPKFAWHCSHVQTVEAPYRVLYIRGVTATQTEILLLLRESKTLLITINSQLHNLSCATRLSALC